MNPNPTVQLVPTYFGFIESTYDALVLFEACLSGLISHVPRRPHDREREHVIKSGNIFIYEESTSGIKRWTDGISWSPSRILGNFLIYRQLQKPFGPGEKKKALKKPKSTNGISKATAPTSQRSKTNLAGIYGSTPGSSYSDSGKMNADVERALIGSLVDSYDFMEDGLVKKTISVQVNGITHHLVSYYTLADAAERKFMVPTKDPKFANVLPRSVLLDKQSFRGPVDEADPIDRSAYGRNRYDMASHNMVGPSMSYMPLSHSQSFHSDRSSYAGGYSLPGSASYDHPSYNTSPVYTSHFTSAQGAYPTPHAYSPHQEGFGSHRYSVVSVSSDGSRAQMPAPQDRRSEIFQQQHGSQDSGIGLQASMSSSLPNTAGMTYYQRPREISTQAINNHSGVSNLPVQRSLPSPPPQNNENYRPSISSISTYDTKHVINNHYDVGMEHKAAMWQMGGNPAVGHGHGHYQTAWPAAAGH